MSKYLLPSPDERGALLDGLARIIEERGHETFVCVPILEPTSEHFPDPWEPSARGVRALSLRLLVYAGLEMVDAEVELYSEGGGDLGGRHHGTAAWFAGIDEDGVCSFGADTRQLEVGEAIVGTMCHEVAHAYREHHRIAGTNRRVEEEDTDITTVYLGFGILTTNNAYRFTTSQGLSGGRVASQWSTSQTGYLSPQAMAFLLAAQVVARASTPREVKRVASRLASQQRDFFRAAHRTLSKDVDALRTALGLPPPETWPHVRRAETPLLPADARFAPKGDRLDAHAARKRLLKAAAVLTIVATVLATLVLTDCRLLR